MHARNVVAIPKRLPPGIYRNTIWSYTTPVTCDLCRKAHGIATGDPAYPPCPTGLYGEAAVLLLTRIETHDRFTCMQILNPEKGRRPASKKELLTLLGKEERPIKREILKELIRRASK